MYNKSQIFRILDKQSNFNTSLEPYLFKTVDTLEVKGTKPLKGLTAHLMTGFTAI